MYISTEEEEEIWGAPVTITGATTGKWSQTKITFFPPY
jgi:hypothetical protein